MVRRVAISQRMQPRDHMSKAADTIRARAAGEGVQCCGLWVGCREKELVVALPLESQLVRCGFVSTCPTPGGGVPSIPLFVSAPSRHGKKNGILRGFEGGQFLWLKFITKTKHIGFTENNLSKKKREIYKTAFLRIQISIRPMQNFYTKSPTPKTKNRRSLL